jgi:Ser/Thr protein kinase RdoA (MazF antagonist)
VKTLPDNPDPDHLRRQAKDLLAGLRDSEPATSLSEAQASLARQYGFRTWPDLVAEVERRRGTADVADETLAGEIAARYGLGRVTAPMRSVARPDDIGRRWVLATDRGRWAVRTLDTWRPIVDVDTEVALQEAAATAGVLLPAPVRSRSCAVVESIGGHRWRVNEWPPSGPPLAAPVSASVAYAVGGILATVHGLRMPVDRLSPWHARKLSDADWAGLVAAAKARGADWAPALAAVAPSLDELETVGSGVQTAPPVLCHNNLTPGNVLLGRGGSMVVAGWEHAGGQPPAWELADALRAWTLDPSGAVNVAGARAMVAGYRATSGAVPPLDPAAFRGAATGLVNYVAGQVETALDAPDGEQRTYADRSVRHLLAHLPTRASFERLLDAVLDSRSGGTLRPR